jgi:hypothetical protein
MNPSAAPLPSNYERDTVSHWVFNHTDVLDAECSITVTAEPHSISGSSRE